MPPVGGVRQRRCRAITPAARRVTKGGSMPPTRRPWRRSSRSCGRPATIATALGCALIVVLWRGGLRVQGALALGERDLDPRRGSLLVRSGTGGRRREIG